jgi:hypothetical protein
MRVGEAKVRLRQIEKYLEDAIVTFTVGPLSGIGETLDKCNELLNEQRTLRRRVQDTEVSTDIAGESVREVVCALEILDTKITLLEKLARRSDLSGPQSEPLFKQLETYRSTRDTLRLSLEKCLWEFELVE